MTTICKALEKLQVGQRLILTPFAGGGLEVRVDNLAPGPDWKVAAPFLNCGIGDEHLALRIEQVMHTLNEKVALLRKRGANG